MMRLWDALRALRSGLIPVAEVRAEAWALGGRHRGEVVDGARAELLAPGITPRRSQLLRAVIRSKGQQRPPIRVPTAANKRHGED